MGLSIIEKILLKHSGKRRLEDFVYAKVDLAFSNDITGPLAVKEFCKTKKKKVFNSRKVAFICDHFTPARDLTSANNVAGLREFSKTAGVKNFFDIHECGIEHAFLPEQGFISPGNLIIGADSHTCTYGALGAASFGVGSTDLAAAMATGRCWFKVPESLKFIYKGCLTGWTEAKDLILYTIGKIGVDGALYKTMEFSGPVIKNLGMDARFTICNMAIEAGGKTGIIEPDSKTKDYIKKVPLKAKPEFFTSDKDAVYKEIYEWDLTGLEPQVACPHLPSNIKGVSQLKKIKLDQIVIGSCTNGRISDLRIAAMILKNRQVYKGLKVIIIPATPLIYRQALKEGLINILFKAGCIISPPTCGPCLGGHTGILGEGQTALATTNRNFIGRMGNPKSFVYLSSPAVAAASAVKGRITHPAEIIDKAPKQSLKRV
jgi:3-isopropylmalate/(R)-2-methylmalate dehydratase large subunit